MRGDVYIGANYSSLPLLAVGWQKGSQQLTALEVKHLKEFYCKRHKDAKFKAWSYSQ